MIIKTSYNDITISIVLYKEDYELISRTLKPINSFKKIIIDNAGNLDLKKKIESNFKIDEYILNKSEIDDVLLKEDIDPKKLIGKNVLAPGINKEIPILPANFVNKKVGSGIVTCVPSDAPNDYVALRTLKEDQTTRNQKKKNTHKIKQKCRPHNKIRTNQLATKYEIKQTDWPPNKINTNQPAIKYNKNKPDGHKIKWGQTSRSHNKIRTNRTATS